MITKKAYIGQQLYNSVRDQVGRSGLGVPVIGTVVAGHIASKAIRAIQNNTRKKALIEDLMMTDPIIKNADKSEVLQYYAVIDSMSPSLALEKPAVKELLQTFVRFGRVDINTLKMLAETEKNKVQSKNTDMAENVLNAAIMAGKALL